MRINDYWHKGRRISFTLAQEIIAKRIDGIASKIGYARWNGYPLKVRYQIIEDVIRDNSFKLGISEEEIKKLIKREQEKEVESIYWL